MAEWKKFGPYKGSAENGGRPIYVYKKKVHGKWVTTSENKARADYESKHGKVSHKYDVDHKDSNHDDDRDSNLHLMTKHDNVAKENKRRAGKHGK